jgi:hypothetical protein
MLREIEIDAADEMPGGLRFARNDGTPFSQPRLRGEARRRISLQSACSTSPVRYSAPAIGGTEAASESSSDAGGAGTGGGSCASPMSGSAQSAVTYRVPKSRQ